MYECYNEAFNYLCDKYGKQDITVTHYGKFSTKEAKTYNNGQLNNHDDIEIDLLLGQYYFGIGAKKDLYYKLLSLGIIKENLVVSI